MEDFIERNEVEHEVLRQCDLILSELRNFIDQACSQAGGTSEYDGVSQSKVTASELLKELRQVLNADNKVHDHMI